MELIIKLWELVPFNGYFLFDTRDEFIKILYQALTLKTAPLSRSFSQHFTVSAGIIQAKGANFTHFGIQEKN